MTLTKLELASQFNHVSVLDELTRSDSKEPTYTLEQLQAVRTGLSVESSLQTIAENAGLDSGEVLDLIAKLGQWITQSRSFGGATVEWTGEAELRLFNQPLGITPGLTKAAGKETRGSVTPLLDEMLEVTEKLDKCKTPQSRARLEKRLAKLRKTRSEMHSVVLHQSFKPKAAGGDVRDVVSSCAMIILGNPGDHDLARYLQRSRKTEKLLTYEHVTLVWMFAKLGRISDLPYINPSSPGLKKVLAEAYNLLETARSDAMRGLKILTDEKSKPEEMRDAAIMLQSIHPGLASRLVRTIDTGVAKLIQQECSQLKRYLSVASDTLVLDEIASLGEEHVLRICRGIGLHTDGSSRVEESHIRARLTQMGLVNDTAKLLHTGVAAARQGVENQFWEAVDRWVDGEKNWDSDLLTLLS